MKTFTTKHQLVMWFVDNHMARSNYQISILSRLSSKDLVDYINKAKPRLDVEFNNETFTVNA